MRVKMEMVSTDPGHRKASLSEHEEERHRSFRNTRERPRHIEKENQRLSLCLSCIREWNSLRNQEWNCNVRWCLGPTLPLQRPARGCSKGGQERSRANIRERIPFSNDTPKPKLPASNHFPMLDHVYLE